jgi:hypothetical protein
MQWKIEGQGREARYRGEEEGGSGGEGVQQAHPIDKASGGR